MSNTKLAQIDELANNLSLTNIDPRDAIKKTNHQVGEFHRQTQLQTNQLSNGASSKRPINGTATGASSHQRQQQGSPILSSPNSSRTSSNISPSSEASSSSSTSSTNSLSTSVPLTRSALRHTSTDLSRRQYSVERELMNSTPLTATLTRVGSCRGAPSNHYHLANQNQSGGSISRDMSNSVMRNPVQSHQPSMRTSKILNIGSQQQQHLQPQSNGSATTTTGLPDPNHLKLAKELKTPNGGAVDSFARPVPGSMANIKLNDNLAFASLRVPKKSSSGSNLNASLIAATTNGRSINSRVSSSSPDKARLIKAAVNGTPPSSKQQGGIGTAGSNGSNSSNKNNNNGHPSVWYEYGCI